MQVFKFGGTSLTSLESFKFILAMLEETQANGEEYVLVVSAVAGVTNRLEAISNGLTKGVVMYHQPYREVLDLHKDLLIDLFGRSEAQAYWGQIKGEFRQLHDHLKKCAQKGRCKKRDQDYILGFGELISAGIVNRFLALHGQQVSFLDARQVIITKMLSLSSSVDIHQSVNRIQEYFSSNPGNKVVPGYIASNKLGQMTTIGRGGSDYTAALFGIALKASAVVKFTDVKGILTADPKIVDQAASVETISADELLNVIKFSSGVVVYPGAVTPLMNHNIPLLIRCTNDHTFPGTQITMASNNRPASIVTLREKSVAVRFKKQFPMPLFKYLAPNFKFCIRTAGNRSLERLMIMPEADWSPLEDFLSKTETSKPVQQLFANYEKQDISVLTLTGAGMDFKEITKEIEELLKNDQIEIIAVDQQGCSLVLVIPADLGRKSAAILHAHFHEQSSSTQLPQPIPNEELIEA